MPVFKRKQASRRQGRGVLSIVIALLLGSAVIRLASGTGSAIALEPGPIQELDHREDPHSPSSEELSRMLAAFQTRQAELDKRASEIDTRMTALKEAEADLVRQLDALVHAEDKLRETLALAEGASETDLSRLTAVYENMKPKDAAALFEEMAPEFAAGFIARMRSEAAAGVMAGLSPQVAYSISVVLAGRHMDVPTE